MQEQSLGKRVKKLRNSQGISQEFLADESGLSIRTIQRIEKDETTPNGDTCRKLSDALKVSPNELMDWTLIEDIDFLKKLNLSALPFLFLPLLVILLPVSMWHSNLSFVFFPLFGILVPTLMWVSKKDKVKDIDTVAKKLINFQITWIILSFLISIFLPPILLKLLEILFEILNTNINLIGDGFTNVRFTMVVMSLVNITYILLNTFRIHDEKKLKYFPSIPFLKVND